MIAISDHVETRGGSPIPDLLRPLFSRIESRPKTSCRVFYLHAVSALGPAQLVRAWLAHRAIDRDVTWVDLAGGESIPTDSTSYILVLEGANLLPEQLDLSDLLTRHQRLVVIGTAAPHRWRTEWDAEVRLPDELRFTDLEVAELAASRGVRFTAEALREVVAHTGGWPTLVDMVISSYGPGDEVSDPDLGLREARAHVSPRLMSSLRPDLRRLAQLMALAGELSADEIEAHGSVAAGASADLRRLGIAYTDHIDGELVYRLHGLVAAACTADLSEETSRGLLVQLAENRQRVGALDWGAGLAYRARDWHLLGQLIDRWGPEMSFSSAAPLLQQAIWEMPREVLVATPGTWHRAEYVGALPLGEAPVEIPTGEEVARAIERRIAPIALRRALMAMVSRRIHHRHGEAVQIARRARPLAEATVRPRYEEIAGATAYWFLQAGVTHELAGNFDEAKACFQMGWQARAHDTTRHAAADLAGKLAAQAAWRGESHQANDWLLEEPTDLDPELWFTTHLHAGFQQARVILADDQLDRDSARRALLRLGRPARVDEYWAWRLATEVNHRLTWDDARGASEMVTAARRRHVDSLAGDGAHASVLLALEAETALALGHGAEARRVLQQLPDSLLGAPAQARLSYLSGDVATTLSQTELSLRRPMPRRFRTQLVLLRAVAALDADDLPTADREGARLLTQVTADQDLRVLLTVPRVALDRLIARVPDLAALIAVADRRGAHQIYPDRIELVQLSDREAAVLEQLVSGRSLKEAAAALFVSINTIKTQTRALYRILDVSDRPSLRSEAYRLGLVDEARLLQDRSRPE